MTNTIQCTTCPQILKTTTRNHLLPVCNPPACVVIVFVYNDVTFAVHSKAPTESFKVNGETYEIEELPDFFKNKRFHLDSSLDSETRRTLLRYVVAYDG